MCKNCSVDSHDKCKWTQIPSKRDVADSLDATKVLLSFIQKNSEQFKEGAKTKISNKEFKVFSKALSAINKKVISFIINFTLFSL